ncbi:MAG: hypothetical protein ABI707_12410 [Ferruginibacter sp.]
MKKLVFPVVRIIGVSFFISCSKSITTNEAANDKAKCGRSVR